MPSVSLNETLIYRARRRTREDGLSVEERVAINLFRRRHVRVPTLAAAFEVSKNTIYYKCLRGTDKADEVNGLISRLGEKQAWNQFVTDEMVNKVNTQMALEVQVREDEERDAT
jgi:hypothetical protein